MAVNTAREDETVREGSKKDTLLRLYRYLFSYKKELIEIMFLLLITLAVTLGSPLLIEYAVDTCVANSDVPGLLRLAVAALSAYIVYLVCTRRWMVRMEDITNRILLTIRASLYEHLQTLSLRFFDSRPTGKILSRVVGDVNSLKEVLSDSVTKLFPDLLTLIGVAAIMLVKNWMLAMAALVMLPVLFGCMFAIQTVEHKRWQIHRKKNSNLNALIHESISGIRLIQSFDAEREKQEEFDSGAAEFTDSWIAAVRIGDLFGPFVEIAWGAGSFLLYFIGLRVVGGDRIGVGTFIAFSTYLGMFWNPIRNLASFYNKIVTNISAAERIFDILDTPADITDCDGAKELPPVRGEVCFENVSFAYAEVQDVRDVKLKSLRSQVGMMTQDTFLFTGTIRENLCYGRQGALPGETGSVKDGSANEVSLETPSRFANDISDEEMIAAAKAVNAHDFIMALENGYDTVISERGHPSPLRIASPRFETRTVSFT